jgi:hypothetical protein
MVEDDTILLETMHHGPEDSQCAEREREATPCLPSGRRLREQKEARRKATADWTVYATVVSRARLGSCHLRGTVAIG